MAEFSARESELMRKYGEEYRNAVDAERANTGPPVVHASWMNLKGGLERYIDWRDRAINEGLQYLKPDSGSTGPNQQDRWASHYQSRGSEAHTQLDNLARNAEEAIQRFMLFVSTQESLFFRQLSQFTFARAAGEIKQTIRELETEASNLEGKWRELAGLDERADGEIATLRAQFLRELENAVAKLLGWSRKAEETARTIVAVGAEYDDKSDPEPSFGPIVAQGMEVVAMVQAPFDMFVREAQRLYQNEAPIHQQFQTLRTRTGEYFGKIYQAAGNAYDLASRESSDSAAQAMPDGNRDDAKRFFEKAKREVDPLLSEFRTAVDKFYDQFSGRFLGEVSDQTAEMLADQEFFNKFWREFEGEHVPEALKQVLDDIDSNWGVSLDPLKPETRKKVQAYFEEKLKSHKEKLRSMDSGFFQRLYDQTSMGIKLAWDNLKRSPGYRK
jgi:hemerythrin superfamily protein